MVRCPTHAAIILVVVLLLVFFLPVGGRLAADTTEPVAADAPGDDLSDDLPAAGFSSAAADESAFAPEQFDAQGNAPILAKVLRYAQRLVQRYDGDGDGVLRREEWQAMGGTPEVVDGDGDGRISIDELAQHVANYGSRRKIRLLSQNVVEASASPPLLHPSTSAESGEPNTAPTAQGGAAVRGSQSLSLDPSDKQDVQRERRFHVSPTHRPANVPDWFSARDANGDGQLTMAEYASKATPTDIEQFNRYDANGDGVMTAHECLKIAKTAPPTSPPQPDVAKP